MGHHEFAHPIFRHLLALLLALLAYAAFLRLK